MKKNILLILTFIISFILLIDNAYAAKELTCIYLEDECQQSNAISSTYKFKKKIVQYSNGEITYYEWKRQSTTATETASNVEFEVVTPPNISYDNTSAYNKESKTLTKCPPCVKYDKTNCNANAVTKDFIFSDYKNDEKKTCPSKYQKLEEQKEEAESKEEAGCKNITAKEAEKDRKEIDYTNTCYYSNVDGNVGATIYFNEDKYTGIGIYDNMQFCIKISELNSINNGKCPEKIWSDNSGTKIFLNKKGDAGNVTSDRMSLYLVGSGQEEEEELPANINSCSDLFGSYLLEKINNVMNIIRITVPILLIIFGIVDFFKATFDNNEDEMKKDRERFIKRIIAAIIVFLVPIFVNLVLDVANTVWSDINSDTCITTTE